MRSKKAIYNIITNLILQLVVIVYGFVIPKIIIQSFGSSVNGLVSSITQFLAYITLLESGVGPVVKAALYKPLAKKDNKEIANILNASEKFFKTISYIFIFYLIILVFVYPFIVSKEFNYIFTFSLVIIISISTFAEYYFGMTYRLFLQANQKTYVISIIQIITYVLSIFSIVLMVKLNFSIHLIKLVGGLIFVGRPLLQNIYVKQKYKINIKAADNNYKLKQKWDGLAQHIASVIHSNTDVTILTLFSSLAEVSVYTIYMLVLKGINSLIQAFTGGIDASFGDMIAKKEHENLNKKYNMYETIYLTITSIFYICTLILIVPFIKVYTKGITDTNYIRPLFGFLITISEFMWAVRLPYSSITLAAGHFKETRKGAWIEAIVNIVLSVILVNKYGIVGVAIGTFAAMLIRTIEFVYHTNKYILKRSVLISLRKILLCALETVLVLFIIHFIPDVCGNTYISWGIYALLIFAITSIIILVINVLLYINDFKQLLNMFKTIRKKVKHAKN